ncbi:hypothetical protein AYI70_g3578 [Smittium culicis]|uniref:Uncharacterized protein n=1 Tax=Smittium culicis TaxID=133412 RepID=A0A1R1Y3F2_9FUNG|nr:hypothetical protein AYI70_g3578 [Smittium culicis]
MGKPIHMFTMESDLSHHQDLPGEDHSNSNHAVLEFTLVVFGPKEPINCSNNQDLSFSSHPRPEKRKISDNSQQIIVTYDLEIKRTWYQEAGSDEQIIKLVLENTRYNNK